MSWIDIAKWKCAKLGKWQSYYKRKANVTLSNGWVINDLYCTRIFLACKVSFHSLTVSFYNFNLVDFCRCFYSSKYVKMLTRLIKVEFYIRCLSLTFRCCFLIFFFLTTSTTPLLTSVFVGIQNFAELTYPLSTQWKENVFFAWQRKRIQKLYTLYGSAMAFHFTISQIYNNWFFEIVLHFTSTMKTFSHH